VTKRGGKLPWPVVAVLVLAVLLGVVAAARGAAPECLDCHDDYLYSRAFKKSVHGGNGCISCHGAVTDAKRHMRGEKKPPRVDCGRCHTQIAARYRQNFHYLQLDFRCSDCHRDIHALTGGKGRDKRAVIEKCTACHGNEEYVSSGHAEAVLRGNRDAADCADCHGLHDTRVFHVSLDRYPQEARAFYSRNCKGCHADPELTKRNNLSAEIVAYYEQTYHGKVQGIGYPAAVAGCADCHTTHNILPKSDPRSSIHSANLAENCGRCHRGFHPRFVEYKAHPDYRDRRRYPALFWTFVFMSALLAGTLCFFWIHTFLWWRKSYWENHRREKMGLAPPAVCAAGEETVQIQRFTPRERLLHVLLILSFFTLVMTGFPLKYHDSPWAEIVIRLWGGAHQAGLFHRGAALVLMAVVAYVAWVGVRYLFPKGLGLRGFRERLLGPDSLFPNRKDWEDMKGMFLWFFDRGEMPRFERWTYWEKFDFWAVFWGMFAIGGSGILLWMPEWSSYLFPGWVLNVAALVHSEEALLAALFIFTVHFFNTHFIPDKFPMDRIIFTGTYTLADLRQQRPLHYERLQAEGGIEEMKRPYPGIFLKLLGSTFGLLSLLLGLALLVHIFWSLIFS